MRFKGKIKIRKVIKMIQELVFIRHGKASDRWDGFDDSKRELTAEGVKELRKIIPSLKMFFKKERDILLWTSPYLRAAQTAEIISEKLDVKKIKVFDFISEGDYLGFSQELVNVKKPASLILVGHAPYLGDWSEKISGYQLPFKKGAAAGYKLNTLIPPTGELLWFVQPKMFLRMK